MSRRRAAALFAAFALAALLPVPVLSASPTPTALPPITEGQTTEPTPSDDPVLAVVPAATPTAPPEAPTSSPSASSAPATTASGGHTSSQPVRAPTATLRASNRSSSVAVAVASAHLSPATTASSEAALWSTPGNDSSGLPFGATLALAAIGAIGLFVIYLAFIGSFRGHRAASPVEAAGTRTAPEEAPQVTPIATRRTHLSPSDDPILTAMGLGRNEPGIARPKANPATAAGRRTRRMRPPVEPPDAGSGD
jgi:hypothetical protein